MVIVAFKLSPVVISVASTWVEARSFA